MSDMNINNPSWPVPSRPPFAPAAPEAEASAVSAHHAPAPHSAYAPIQHAYPSLPPGAPLPPLYNTPGATTPQPPTDGNNQRRGKRAGRTIALLTAAAVIAAAAGYGGSWLYDIVGNGGARPIASQESGTITINNPGAVSQTTAIAAEALPSVVTIDVATDSTSGSGSGVILSEDGYILTNTHVVTLDGATGAADVRATLSDGRIYAADIVGTDPTYDLAVIKLKDATGLPVITWGDSTKLNVGDVTVALGAPLGLANSVTEGIVSTLDRSIQVASAAAPDTGEKVEDDGSDNGGPFTFDLPGRDSSTAKERISIAVIQTDAAINPGNSGGALVNSEGDLIGINVAIATPGGASGTAGSIGLGFAIPSHVAQRIATELMENGKATHGLLGASVMNASGIKGATMSGAYIAEVSAGGAAEGATIKKGDVVTHLGSVRINDATDLTAQVRALAAGARTTVTFLRDGKSFEADVTLGSL